jgi:4-amino-4-deoxy-L-arabinose transferase-like glycosyltransferase
MKRILGWKTVFVLVIFLASFLRIYQLGNVPYGTTNDETAYIYNSYSIWKTGKDITGKFMPLSFNAHSSESPTGVYLTAPFVGIMGLSLFSGRFPSALLGIGSTILLFLLADFLFKNKWIGIISALLYAISPWALQFSRGFWDIDFASFFFLLGIYIFITNVKNGKFIWSLIPFILGFYSYHATKVYFVFLIPILIFLFRKKLLVQKKNIIIFIIGILAIFASFSLVSKFQNVTRYSEVTLLNDPNAAKNVDWERQKNTAPFIVRQIFSNKPLYYLRIIRENYLEAFSINYLFLYGETGGVAQINNIFFRGELYIIELPLLLFGIYKLLTIKNISVRNLLFALLLIGPIPSAITTQKSFTIRDYMMLPILLIITAAGLYFLIMKILNIKNFSRVILLSSIIFVYSFLFAEYFYQYHYRWSVYGAETWSASSRDLVNYIAQEKDKFDNVYVSKPYKDLLIQYALFEKISPKIVQKAWNEDQVKILNITMFKDCLGSDKNKVSDFLPPRTLYVSSFESCHYASITSDKIIDRGEPLRTIWNIYLN